MRWVWVSCVFVVVLALGVATASADVYPGSYGAKAKGLRVKLEVGQSGGGSLSYSMKSACGRSRGKLELSKSGAGLRGRRVRRGPKASLRTTTVKVGLGRDGEKIVGTIKESLRGGETELAGCRGKRSFQASVAEADGFIPARDVGHYSGTAANGLAISFDVVADGADARVANIDADVQADCVDESDPAGDEFGLITHIRDLEGKVAKDGSFYIDYTPDEDTEYEVDGKIANGQASVDVVVGGYFNEQGDPSAAGPFACDSWGDLYRAALQ